jgi:phosphatidate cytidylyltransferase
MTREAIFLMIGLTGLLGMASMTAWAIAWRSPQPLESTLVNLQTRIKAWWLMMAVIFGAFLLGTNGVIVLFAFVSFAALREYVTLTHFRRSDHWILLAMFLLVLPAQYLLIWWDWYGLFSIFIPVYCFLVMPALAATMGDTDRFLDRVAEQQWGVMLAIYCVSHIPALATLRIEGFEGKELLLIAFLIVTVQGSDVLQYIFGKLFGRRLLAPRVSPSKTWEGLVGGLAVSSLLGAALFPLTPYGPLGAGALAALSCMMGVLGGLVASAVKRDRGIKDWGHLIDGHGGMLDRADSLIFAAPVFFHIVRYTAT